MFEITNALAYFGEASKIFHSEESSGLYYKTITIVIMMIVSDATIWSVTYGRN